MWAETCSCGATNEQKVPAFIYIDIITQEEGYFKNILKFH